MEKVLQRGEHAWVTMQGVPCARHTFVYLRSSGYHDTREKVLAQGDMRNYK